MELVIIVTVQEAYLVPSVWDKVVGAMVCFILNVGCVMVPVLYNAAHAMGQENENNNIKGLGYVK